VLMVTIEGWKDERWSRVAFVNAENVPVRARQELCPFERGGSSAVIRIAQFPTALSRVGLHGPHPATAVGERRGGKQRRHHARVMHFHRMNRHDPLVVSSAVWDSGPSNFRVNGSCFEAARTVAVRFP
jgi:hypothetical protein